MSGRQRKKPGGSAFAPRAGLCRSRWCRSSPSLAVDVLDRGRSPPRAQRSSSDARCAAPTVRAHRRRRSPRRTRARWRAPSRGSRDFSGAYEGDLVADELRASGALQATLARPFVYVRGPARRLHERHGHRRGGIARHEGRASSSVSWSLRPSRTEKVLLGEVRIAYRAVPDHGAAHGERAPARDGGGWPAVAHAGVGRARARPLRTLRRAHATRSETSSGRPSTQAKQAATGGIAPRRRWTSPATAEARPSSTASAPTGSGSRSSTSRRRRSSSVLRRRVDPSWISLAKKSRIRERPRRLRARARRAREHIEGERPSRELTKSGLEYSRKQGSRFTTCSSESAQKEPRSRL